MIVWGCLRYLNSADPFTVVKECLETRMRVLHERNLMLSCIRSGQQGYNLIVLLLLGGGPTERSCFIHLSLLPLVKYDFFLLAGKLNVVSILAFYFSLLFFLSFISLKR